MTTPPLSSDILYQRFSRKIHAFESVLPKKTDKKQKDFMIHIWELCELALPLTPSILPTPLQKVQSTLIKLFAQFPNNISTIIEHYQLNQYHKQSKLWPQKPLKQQKILLLFPMYYPTLK